MESLHRCVIINAQSFFAMAWSVVSGALHDRTRAKTPSGLETRRGAGAVRERHRLDPRELPRA